MNVAMPFGSCHGWGIAGINLAREMSLLPHLEGVTLHCIIAHNFFPFDTEQWNRINIGYCFFEYDLLAGRFIQEAARRWDFIVAGSSWCEQQLRDNGMERTTTILQGIDHDLFDSRPPRLNDGRFIVFSGGKFEFRKGQDLAIAAMRIFMERHRDVWFSCAWHNIWPDFVKSMEQSRLINFAWRDEPCEKIIMETLSRNGMDMSRIVLHGRLDNGLMPFVYAESDIGLFPNRCEGGNNMIMCEYMACGRTVIATPWTGHADVLNSGNALLATARKDIPVFIGEDQTAVWAEPDVDELVNLLEQAYTDRYMLRCRAEQASRDMQRLSWHSTAKAFHCLGTGMANRWNGITA